jgi:hypothetical protein
LQAALPAQGPQVAGDGFHVAGAEGQGQLANRGRQAAGVMLPDEAQYLPLAGRQGAVAGALLERGAGQRGTRLAAVALPGVAGVEGGAAVVAGTAGHVVPPCGK